MKIQYKESLCYFLLQVSYLIQRNCIHDQMMMKNYQTVK